MSELKKEHGNKMTKETFMKKLHDKYDGIYLLDKVEYTSLNNYIILICPKHGEFKLIAKTAISKTKKGMCPVCHIIEMKANKKPKPTQRMTTKTFIEKGNLKYNNKYDYSKVDMENRREDGKVCIICHEKNDDGTEHGEFWQLPNMHLYGKSCPICGSRNKTHSTFMKQLEETNTQNFSFEKTIYKNIYTPVIVHCNTCDNDFSIMPRTLLKNRRCPICSKIFGTSFEQFEAKSNLVHHNFYTYYKDEWQGKAHDRNIKIRITCPIHGDFFQNPGHHMEGSGCPSCNNSKLEEEIFGILRNMDIRFEVQKQFEWLGKLKLDFYLNDYNIAIECQGRQHFEAIDFFGGDKALEYTKECDLKKAALCKENGITLLYYSNLGIDYPYEVHEDKNLLIEKIKELSTS